MFDDPYDRLPDVREFESVVLADVAVSGNYYAVVMDAMTFGFVESWMKDGASACLSLDGSGVLSEVLWWCWCGVYLNEFDVGLGYVADETNFTP